MRVNVQVLLSKNNSKFLVILSDRLFDVVDPVMIFWDVLPFYSLEEKKKSLPQKMTFSQVL